MKNYLIDGVVSSAVAVGCMRISGIGEAGLSRLIHTALELGVNFFDHADIYGGGTSEELFGRVLSKEPGLRERLVLQSKCGIKQGMYDFSREHILSSVDGILRRLHTDHLDFLLLHRPDPLMEPDEVGEAFEELSASGKVLHFGVSNFSTRQLMLLSSGVKQKLSVDQMQFGLKCTGLIDHAITANTDFPHSADRDGEVLDYCRLNDITIQAWSPFQYGFFEGSFIDNPKFPKLNETLGKLAEKYGVGKSAIAAAWILRHPAKIQVISGSTNPDHLTDVCAGTEIELTRAEWYELYLSAGNVLP